MGGGAPAVSIISSQAQNKIKRHYEVSIDTEPLMVLHAKP